MRRGRLKAWYERLERKLAEEHGEESQIDCEKIHEKHFFEVALPRTTTGRRHNLGTFAPLLMLTTLHLLIPRGQACWRLGCVISYMFRIRIPPSPSYLLASVVMSNSLRTTFIFIIIFMVICLIPTVAHSMLIFFLMSCSI